jgi:hypothetical protein
MKHKHLFSILFLLPFLVIVFSWNGYSFIRGNGAGGGYGDEEEEGQSLSVQAAGDQAIEYYIMEGGGYYLEANASIQKLLNRVELQEIQGLFYPELQWLSGSALYWLQRAGESYERLIRIAEATPYNPAVLEKLRTFDYDGFKSRYDLNSDIFSLVRSYLQQGDITGLFRCSHRECLEMIDILKQIRDELNFYRLPDLALFWQLNEKQSTSSLLGSYVARIFSKLR